jgi:hypothetical protein
VGNYIAYANYIRSAANGWGLMPDANTTTHVISDGEGRTDTRVVILGNYGDVYCGPMPFTMPTTLLSAVYRFGVYFTNSIPTGPYHLNLAGFVNDKYSPSYYESVFLSTLSWWNDDPNVNFLDLISEWNNEGQ